MGQWHTSKKQQLEGKTDSVSLFHLYKDGNRQGQPLRDWEEARRDHVKSTRSLESLHRRAKLNVHGRMLR